VEINVLNNSEAFYWGATSAFMHGTPASPRGMKTLEIQNFTINILHPAHGFGLPAVRGRTLRPFIAAVEALQLVGQQATPDTVLAGSKVMQAYADDGVFAGAYGQRVYGQLGHIERALAADPHTRQAVLSIYDGPNDLGRTVKDVPCTLTIQFLWQYGHAGLDQPRLGMRVSMRSNDVWLGLPYDLFQFTALQMALCDSLGVLPGRYTHTVGSLHAYEKDWDSISMLENPGSPPRHEFEYEGVWGAASIAEISSRARRLLADTLPDDEKTAYEHFLGRAVLL
jgi:thymidylate synthase